MDLFKRKLQVQPPMMVAADSQTQIIPASVNYDSVLEYLVGLSAEEYTLVCQTAAIYRQADFEAAKIHGRKLEPTTFIKPRKLSELIKPGDFLDDDDSDIARILDDEPEFIQTEPPKRRSRAIKVKD